MPDPGKSTTPTTVAYVGTIVGESTSREFRLALAHEAVREQDVIAVDADLKRTDGSSGMEPIRVWAKVQRIERVNPLFPHEAGHELAATQTNPLDTVLSLSREMVTAVCQVLGSEARRTTANGKLDQLRYPAQPASQAYRPNSADVARVVVGDLEKNKKRAVDLAHLSNRPDIDVLVDGHDIVTRHLAILAMTGAGKSWTARRIIEQMAGKNYPIVIFDPHGDYTGLADVSGLGSRVRRFYASFPVFDQDAETVEALVDTLGYALTDTMRGMFDQLFSFAARFVDADATELTTRAQWLSTTLGNPDIARFGIKPDLWVIGNLAEVVEVIAREDGQPRLNEIQAHGWNARLTKADAKTLEGLKKRCRRAAAALRRMEDTNRRVAKKAEPLPTDRAELVKYGQVSVVSLAGYTSDFQATIYSLIAEDIFEKRVREELKLPVLFVLEEAHNFAPGHPATDAEKRAVTTTRQVAQEGRKFGVGQVLISQRPSRLDETTLSQCNSFIIMRMVNPADQNFVRRVIETLGEDEAKLLPDLDVGEALLSGQFINFPVLVRIKEPESRGEREEEDAFQHLEQAQAALARTAR
ncbi:MAG: ATP-binding protein [Zavarzinella sp.]|nr:ATP-binding protein [Zavarzinella sp.]